MSRRQAIALALVSVWTGWTLFMWFAATRSFRTANRVGQNPRPEFAQLLAPLGKTNALVVLRHFASEVNAVYFRAYGLAQIILGTALVILLLGQFPRDTTALVVACMMLALALALALVIEPQIAGLGRKLDFNPSPQLTARFWTLHGVYTGLDAFKLVAALVLAVRWILMA